MRKLRGHPKPKAPPGTVPGAESIIDRLRWGPATVEELARVTGLTPNGVRAQLLGFEGSGWVRRAGIQRRPGAGKPANLYELAPEAEPRLSRAYLPVLLALVRALAEGQSRSSRRALYRRVGRELAQAHSGPPGADFERRLETALDVVSRLGGAMEVRREGKRVLLRGAGCPVGAAVALDDCVCHATATLLTRLLGVPVADRCARQPRPRCRFELTPTE